MRTDPQTLFLPAACLECGYVALAGYGHAEDCPHFDAESEDLARVELEISARGQTCPLPPPDEVRSLLWAVMETLRPQQDAGRTRAAVNRAESRLRTFMESDA